MSATNYLLRLDVIVNGQVAYSETVDQEKAKVGTLGSSTLRLNQPGVSTIHAVIERQGPDSFLLSDLGSAAGTYVNGSRIQRHVLSHGDQIYFGDALVIASLVDANVLYAQAYGQQEYQQAPVGGVAGIGANVPSQITLADGTVVVPYGDSGYYDNDGNYIPGYYDEFGEYHLGYGYVGENGEWVVVYGYYDVQGDWVDTDGPVSAVAAEKSNWRFDGISDKRVYTESYFADQGGDTLEVAMIWEDSVLSVTNFKDGDVVTISSDPKSNSSYVLADKSLTMDPFPLVDTKAGSIFVTPSMRTLLCKSGQEMTLEQAIAGGFARQQGQMISIPLDPRTSASVEIGEVTFVIHYTRIPTVILTGPSFDYAQLGFYGLSFALHVLFLLLILMVPPDSDALNLDSFGANDRYAELLIQAQEEIPPDDPSYLKGDGDDGADKGKEDSKSKEKNSGGPASKDAKDQPVDPGELPANPSQAQIELKKAYDTKVAKSAGIVSLFGGGGPSGGAFGAGGPALGDNAMGAIGAFTDSSATGNVGEVRDAGGLGLATGGRVGPGGDGSIGIGGPGGGTGIGTLGKGGGGGGGRGYGANPGKGLGSHNASAPALIVPGNPTIQGALDKEIIRRVIRQHRNEMKFCYEQQLQKDRSLKGRVVISFTIAQRGNVIAARVKETTLNNAAAENCMLRKIKFWSFPTPKGGGMAQVNYPFNFST